MLNFSNETVLKPPFLKFYEQIIVHAFGGRKIWKYNEEHGTLKCLICPNTKLLAKFKPRIKKHATSKITGEKPERNLSHVLIGKSHFGTS